MKKNDRSNAILEAVNAAAAEASASAQSKIAAPAPLPASTPVNEVKRIRFSGYFSEVESAALSKIRVAYAGERLPDNLLVRAAVRAATPELLRVHLAEIQAEDRRLSNRPE